MSILILIPVLGRPHRVAKVVDSIRAAQTVDTTVVFLCSPGDDDEIGTAAANPGIDLVATAEWQAGPGDYARKINHGYSGLKEVRDFTHVFTGADDLRFEHGWDAAALDIADRLQVGVVGTNDLGNALVMRGGHSTHSLISRRYIEEVGATYSDGPGVILHEGYDHQQIDVELVHAAQMRKEWAFLQTPAVEHLHPFWNATDGNPKAPMDDTYRKALRASRADQRVYAQRRRQFMVARTSSRVATQRIQG